jgi:putative membrane protein
LSWERRSLPERQVGLLSFTALFALLSLVGTPFPDLAPLQNLPTLVILTILAWALKRQPLPDSAVTCLCLFLCLHTLGGRYAYSYVPYDHWFEGLGLPAPSELLGLQRNAYDRLVHFSFGLLMIHPIAEFLGRSGAVSRKVALYIAVEFVFAGSALYEIFEWLLTLVMAGPSADAYNGQQGDIWDAQKDMACAVCGALVSVCWLVLRSARTRMS